MKVQTRDFGALVLDEKELFTMVSPIFGFEKLERFALLVDNELEVPFEWFQSVDDQNVCFVLLDPMVIFPEYAPAATDELMEKLGVSKPEDIMWRVMTVIPEDFNQSTVNLKSPIAFYPEGKHAAQIILEADYPVRTMLVSREQEGSPC